MTTVHSYKEVKASKPSIQVAVAFMLLLPIVGIFCLAFPALAEDALPLLLGVPMVLSGVGSIVAAARERDVPTAAEAPAAAMSESAASSAPASTPASSLPASAPAPASTPLAPASAQAPETSMGAAIVRCVLGMVVIAHGWQSLTFIGIVWGVLGLDKAAGEFDGIFRDIRHHRPFALALAVCVFELVLAVLLIWNPSANIEHHLILLGIELIVYPFKIHREQGRLKLEAEA